MKIKFDRNIFFISIIICLLFIVRFIKFGQIPQSLYWDEYAIGVDAYSISQTAKGIHGNPWFQAIYPSYGDFKAPVPIWLTSISTRLFGLNQFSTRLPFAVTSVIGIIGLILLFKELIKELKLSKTQTSLITLIFSIFLFTMPWLFHFGRIGFESGMSLTFVIWSCLFLIKGLKTNHWQILIASILGSISIYVYFSTRYIVPLFFAAILISNIKSAWYHKYWIIGAVILFFVIYIPIFTSPFYRESQILRLSTRNIISDTELISQSTTLIEQSGNSLFSRIIYHRYLFIIKAFLQNYFSHFTPQFLFLTGDINLRHHTGWGGQLLFSTMPFLLFGLYYSLKNIRFKFNQITLAWLFLSPITAAFPYEVPHASRAIYMIIPLSILLITGFIQISNLFNKKHYLQLIVITIVLLSANFFGYLEDYFQHYPTRSYDSWQLGNKYIGKVTQINKQNYEKLLITDSFRLGSLPVLFYNPEYILTVQSQNIKNQGEKKYFWTREFDKFSFDENIHSSKGQKTLYISTKPNNQNQSLIENYSAPDGKMLLYIYQKK